MKQSIKQRVDSLRAILRNEGIQAFIIPSTDPHMSEYVAPHWQSREWISGFTGSAGTVVITLDDAGLWTDSRYFLQAAEQLKNSGIALYKEMLPETPSIPSFLTSKLHDGDCVGIDGSVFSTAEAHALKNDLAQAGISFKSIADPMNQLWSDRPSMPDAPVFIHEMQYAGKSIEEKLSAIRQEMAQNNVESILISALDEIAWTLNLRGNDVHCNPVFISYLFITSTDVHLFIQPNKLTQEVADYLHASAIQTHDYAEIGTFLHTLTAKNILLNPQKTNYALYTAINPACNICEGASPITLLKSIRNEQEIAGIHNAMTRDGIALVKFLKWLEEAVPQGNQSEISVDKKLHQLRAEQPLYMGESFDTIAGYKAHGAIVHYEATPESDAKLAPEGFLLLDSGAQYLDGTTDITRTIALGELTEEEKEDYTLILKGHINLAMAVFPEGTRGAQLDALARIPIWKRGMNYLHGTGHGIGHFLNVHEGPQSIRMNENPITLRPGMLTSNEPGVYKTGSHGIRIENLILTTVAGEGMYGRYLQFETVTLCPICKKGIIKSLLNAEEIEWFNHYHLTVFNTLSPYLNKEEKNWLQQACEAI